MKRPIKKLIKDQKGITLIEIMIVSIILLILVIILTSILQVVSMRSRDAVRLSDMAVLYQAIQAKINSSESSDKLYYILCTQVKTPCEGSSFPPFGENRNIDGKGWLKIAFTKNELLKFSTLPIDPINNNEFNYHYFSDGKMWKIETKLESDNLKDKMKYDGGIDPDKYELIVNLKD